MILTGYLIGNARSVFVTYGAAVSGKGKACKHGQCSIHIRNFELPEGKIRGYYTGSFRVYFCI